MRGTQASIRTELVVRFIGAYVSLGVPAASKANAADTQSGFHRVNVFCVLRAGAQGAGKLARAVRLHTDPRSWSHKPMPSFSLASPSWVLPSFVSPMPFIASPPSQRTAHLAHHTRKRAAAAAHPPPQKHSEHPDAPQRGTGRCSARSNGLAEPCAAYARAVRECVAPPVGMHGRGPVLWSAVGRTRQEMQWTPWTTVDPLEPKIFTAQ